MNQDDEKNRELQAELSHLQSVLADVRRGNLGIREHIEKLGDERTSKAMAASPARMD